MSTDGNGLMNFNSSTPFDPQNAISTSTSYEMEKYFIMRGSRSFQRQYFRTSDYAYHHLYKDYNKFCSDWISLEKDQFYKIESRSGLRDTSHGHTISVEFEKASTDSHPLTNYKVQHLEITHDATFDSWDITILNPDGKTFKMVFAYQDKEGKMSLWTSEAISTDVHQSTLWHKLFYGFFNVQYQWNYLGHMTKTSYDAQDTVTTDKTKIVKTVYSFKSIRLVNFVSFTQISLTEK